MKKLLLLLLLFTGMANAQIVNIPDAAFKAKLLEANVTNPIASDISGSNMKIDTNNDGEIQVTEALSVYRLRVWSAAIFDLTGISSFTNVTQLDCSSNILFNLDVSALANLTSLNCSGNFLTTLNLSGLTNLTQVFCEQNRLTGLNLTGLTNLTQLICSNNQLGTLDLTGLTSLGLVLCESAHLTTLNVTGLTNLHVLICNFNNLTNLNLTGMTSLEQLQCSHNEITALNLTGLSALTTLNCFYNQITNLDFSSCPNLINLTCGENNIPILNLNGLTHLAALECSYLPNNVVINGSNLNALTNFQYTGSNSAMSLNGFPGIQNLSLTLSQPAITLNLTGFNSQSNIYLFPGIMSSLTVNGSGLTNIQSLNCSNSQLTTLSLNGLNSLTGLNCSNNKLTGLNLTGLTSLNELNFGRNKITTINLSGLTNLKRLDVNNNKLTGLNLTGLPNLEYLDCSNNSSVDIIGNQLTSLNLVGSPNLKYLDCSNYQFALLGASGNQITSLSINSLTHLEQLKCAKNSIATLVVNGLTNLTDLDCSQNQLTSLDLIGLTNLVHLNYSSNTLSNLNMTGLVNITELDCSNNSIATLNVVNMPNLTKLNCSNNSLGTLNLSGLTHLTHLYCDSNNLLTLSVSALTNLVDLSCNANLLDNLDVNNLTNLTSLRCAGNQLTNLNVTALTNLHSLTCGGNLLTSLDVGTLTNLYDLGCDFNGITTLDVSHCPLLGTLTCGNNELNNLDLSNLTHLYALSCSNNHLTSLSLNTTTNLLSVYCDHNEITSLDVTASSHLTDLVCNDNLLTELFMKNGTTESFLNVANNPLAYICADDAEVASVQTQLNTLGMTATVCNSYCSFTPGGPHNTVTGTTIFDGNNNGCNSNDPLHPNIRIDITDGNITGSAFTNTEGVCTFYTEAGNYTIFPNIENASAFNISPANANITFTNNDDNVSNQSFCISANGVHPDVEIVVMPIGPARPGFDAEYKLVYKNKGNQSLSGNLQLVFDDAKLNFISALPTADSQVGNSLNWAYSALLPFESRDIKLVFHLNSPTDTPPVNNGDVLTFATSVTPVIADETPLDNQFLLEQTAVGAFDPNQKTCLEGNTVSSVEIGGYLHYNIDFENLGSAEATNVVVKDIIDTNMFDINSLQVLYASHEMRASIRGNVVEFIFRNINLAPAVGDPPVGGHGTILFKIKTLPTLQSGDQVSNVANIYFDYNAPISTNEARTTFAVLSNATFTPDESVVVYPNPAKDYLNISCDTTIKSVELYDVQGRLLETAVDSKKQMRLGMGTQSKGLYFVRITTEKGKRVEKVIKE